MFEVTDQSRIYVHRSASRARIPTRRVRREDARGKTKQLFYDQSFKIISLQRLYQSKLSFGKGIFTGKDKETERRRTSEGDGDKRGEVKQ